MTCARYECGGTARWHPVLQFRAPEKFEPCPFIPAILGMVLCDACMANAKVEDFMSEELKDLMRRMTKGMNQIEPDWARTTLGKEKLNSKYSELLRKRENGE